jgi:sugar phosphate permease
MTGNAPTFAAVLRVFLPFALAYFLSHLPRRERGDLPYLERDIGITAGDLGLLTSAFFLFFAGCQPVLGVALYRYGPRRVQAVLLVMAAVGSALFGLSLSLGELILARALIGLGFAGGLMAAIKAITLWYPPQRWGVITGLHMMAGGLGSMAATLPIQWSLSVMTWQGLFFWLAGLCLATAAILLAVVPERSAAASKGTLGEQFRITGIVLTDGFYWRIQPLLSVQQLAFIGCITLWIGPWLRRGRHRRRERPTSAHHHARS